ncbi:hypothetical protein [Paenibacillus terrae]|uniref:Uncharacterized protein n=1 Tax=Paenibacillus terrae TaxID=159743 RepID=A0A0D7WYW0_9BACL|nr:hypothetical protein [Paenibacillus terrae]KJD44174.1 hypothetical protein QD47_18395 [Paenibacillus terrae]
MNWVGKRSWLHEDELYSPKRKVSNKGSRKYTHIIGSFPSIKMNRHIGYESLWGECLFYYFLELDPMTIRYYPQPIDIQLQLINKDVVKVKKEHVPEDINFYNRQLNFFSENIVQKIFVLNQLIKIYEKNREPKIKWCSETYYSKQHEDIEKITD